jgi:RimJ/RimL family protein N-acetyltransferase
MSNLTLSHIGPAQEDPAFYQRIATFVQHQSVLLQNWSPTLLEKCLITVIRDGDNIAAVVWFHDANDLTDGSIMIHVAASERYRGRWLSIRVIGETLGNAFDVTGTCRIYAHVTSAFVGDIWRRVGFKFLKHEGEGLLAYKDREEWQAT